MACRVKGVGIASDQPTDDGDVSESPAQASGFTMRPGALSAVSTASAAKLIDQVGSNGSGTESGQSGHVATAIEKDLEIVKMQQDAPPCPDCGSLTVRSGACYKCMQCGSSLGCS